MTLPSELIELFSEFAAGEVRYLLVGGHAVAAHGRPRSTKDVDLWLESVPENLERASAALRRFGVPGELAEALRRARPDEIVWIGRAPLRVDFLQSLPGVDFSSAWPRRLIVRLDDIEVPVIGKEDLICNKRTVGRAQDLRDVRALTSAASPARRASKPRAGGRRTRGG